LHGNFQVFFKKIANIFRRPPTADLNQFRELFERFQQILKGNNRVFELISELEDKLSGEYIFDINYLIHVNDQLSQTVYLIISNLNVIADNRYRDLFSRQAAIQDELDNIIKGQTVSKERRFIVDYANVDSDIAELVGGKNANLGEIKNHLKMPAPGGFVLSTAMYKRFMEENNLWPEIRKVYEKFAGEDRHSAEEYDHAIDNLFNGARVPSDLARAANRKLSSLQKDSGERARFAVRSSAFGEDVLGRSFAGQFKSFLYCRDDDVLRNYIRVIASRFNYNVATYAGDRTFKEAELPMAVGVQEMIDAHVSGVAYSLDPSGEFSDSLAISACYGLGIGTVEGMIDTDYFRVSRIDPSQIYARRIGRKKSQVIPAEGEGVETVPVKTELSEKACLTDVQIIDLAEHILILDRYFKRPVDVEW
jgi:pyruvate,water dikinase